MINDRCIDVLQLREDKKVRNKKKQAGDRSAYGDKTWHHGLVWSDVHRGWNLSSTSDYILDLQRTDSSLHLCSLSNRCKEIQDSEGLRDTREWRARESRISVLSRMSMSIGNPFASVRKQSWSIKWSFYCLSLYWFVQYSCISIFVGIYRFLPGNDTRDWTTSFVSMNNCSFSFRYQILFELLAFVGITEIFFYYSHLMLVRTANSCCCSSNQPICYL